VIAVVEASGIDWFVVRVRRQPEYVFALIRASWSARLSRTYVFQSLDARRSAAAFVGTTE
jgi:hypothetical protein